MAAHETRRIVSTHFLGFYSGQDGLIGILIFFVLISAPLSNWRKKHICGYTFNEISHWWVHIHFKYFIFLVYTSTLLSNWRKNRFLGAHLIKYHIFKCFNFSCSHLCTTFKLENKIDLWVYISTKFHVSGFTFTLKFLIFLVHTSARLSNWRKNRFVGEHLTKFHIRGWHIHFNVLIFLTHTSAPLSNWKKNRFVGVRLIKFHIRGCTFTLNVLIFLIHTSTSLSNWRKKQICGC